MGHVITCLKTWGPRWPGPGSALRGNPQMSEATPLSFVCVLLVFCPLFVSNYIISEYLWTKDRYTSKSHLTWKCIKRSINLKILLAWVQAQSDGAAQRDGRGTSPDPILCSTEAAKPCNWIVISLILFTGNWTIITSTLLYVSKRDAKPTAQDLLII